MRQLLRRRHAIVDRRRFRGAAVAIGMAIATLSLWGASDNPSPTVRITSPLGRTDLPGMVRFVARVTSSDKTTPSVVRFYVDHVLLASDSDGPPYVAEWEDVNPFESRTLAVEAEFTPASIARDEIELKPLDLIETAQINSVGLDATVQDRGGRYVTGLTGSQFELREDGVPQSLDSVSAEEVPATFALLIDTSQSMARSIDVVRRAAARLTDYARPDDSFVVAPFKHGVFNVTGPTKDRDTVADAIAAVRPAGGTAILDALMAVATRFGNADQRRVIVLITDGYDESSETPIEEVLAVLKRSQATVYVIAVNGIAGVSIDGETLLRRIASETGARAFFPWNGAGMAAAHAAIAEDARSRYRLTYTPTNQRQDGTQRTIELVVKDQASYLVRARAGYVAPSPPPVRASLEFSATDTSEDYVDLAREDLQVVEDGIAQDVDVFHEAVAPVSIVLALDSSGSMKPFAAAAQDAARTFVAAVRPLDQLAMTTFADGVTLVHGFSSDRAESLHGIDSYVATGGTALYDSLSDGLTQLAARDGRRVLVVVSDGRDENAASNGPGSRRQWADVLAQARAIDATVYPIGLGSKVDVARLKQLAELTGGDAFFASQVSDLPRHYLRIVEAMRRSYVVGYTSTNPARDGAWRKVEIRSLLTGVHVRSRGGYFAPPQ